MKITVNTFGTRGDVQPYIALSLGLERSGHQVRILSHDIFEADVKNHGLDFHPLALNPHEVLVNQALSELGNNIIRINQWMGANFRPVLRDIFTATLIANRDAELVINSGLSFAGWHVAEKLGVPALAAYLWPIIPSRYLPPASGKIPPDWMPFRSTFNYLSTKLSNQMFFNLLLSPINHCRKEILGLRPMGARDYWRLDSSHNSASFIYGYSNLVVPKPPDWSSNQQVTGYWFLDNGEGYQPEQALVEFLSSGPAPIYIGFGSMVDHKNEEVTQTIIKALEETQQRGILLAGWGDMGKGLLPDNIFRVDSVPHDWLFPRVAAVVHHGGAGTTAAGLRAGVPSVIIPSFGDQFFWGWRVHKLGVGPKPISRKKLTINSLSGAIQQAISEVSIRDKSVDLGRKIRAENGVETAVELIEIYARDGHF